MDLDWWHERMSSKWKEESKSFESLDIKTPCCESDTTLNDFRYDWAAAFGLCILEVFKSFQEVLLKEFDGGVKLKILIGLLAVTVAFVIGDHQPHRRFLFFQGVGDLL